jgi:hypothetical protein
MSSVVEKIGDLVKGFGLGTVYGEVTELNGVYIMPVALSFHAFGAGEGRGNGGAAAQGEGSGGPGLGEGEGNGGGGMAASVPFGAYVRDIRGLRFEPNLVTMLAVATPLVWVSGKALSRLMHGKRHRR